MFAKLFQYHTFQFELSLGTCPENEMNLETDTNLILLGSVSPALIKDAKTQMHYYEPFRSAYNWIFIRIFLGLIDNIMLPSCFCQFLAKEEIFLTGQGQ